MSTVKTRNLEKLMSNISLGSTSFQAPSKLKNDLVIVDSKIDNYQQLVSGVRAGFEVIAIEQVENAIGQITEILSNRTNINTIHIVSHGQEAAIQLGSTELNIDNLETYSSQLQQWGKALSESGSILLYGCNIAAGESGMKFVQKISEITGVNVAASNNLTGSAALGGDWELEITTGQINVELAFKKAVLESYTSVLATLVTEDFKKTTVIGPWIYGVGNTLTPNPGLTAGPINNSGVLPNLGGGDPTGTGALQLTSNAYNQAAMTFGQAAFLIYNNPIAATGGLRVTFDFFAYNRGTVADGNSAFLGADGISFFLIDGTATPTKAGGFGGSLGYAQNTSTSSPGILGGYLGVGLDEFGNFSNNNAGRVGGPGQIPDAVGIRGSESTSYNFLTSAVVTGGIDNATTTSRAAAKRSVQITLFPATSATPNRLSVAFDTNNNGSFDINETLIDIPNLSLVNGAVPPTFKFGFAASTGGNTNIHEINNVLVETIDPPTLVADVSIVKKGPQFAKPGGTITYTITSTNNGPNTAENVLIQDPLPAGLTFLSADNGASFDTKTGTVIWPLIPTLANGASVTRTITATVPTTLTSLINTAYSSSSTFDPILTNNNSSQPISQVPTTITNAPLADVVTTKSGAATATAGRTVSYTITTQNNGPDTADNVTITDSIIPGLTGVVLSDSGTYNTTTGIVTFPAVTLANAVTTPRSISFIAPANLSVSNTARSTSSTLDPTPDNNDGSALGAQVTTTLTPSADVITTKSGITNAAAGSIVGYTITTQNIGPSTAENITITDSIIPGLTGVVLSDSGTYNTTTGIVTFPAVSLTNTASTTRSISFIAPTNLNVSNTARSTSSTVDPTPSNNDGTAPGAQVTTTLTPSADVITTKSGITNAAAGSIVGYTITTRNIGPSTAENVTITDSIIPGLTGVVLSDSGTYNAPTGIVTFPAVSLTNTASTTRSISFIAPNSGSISNTARSTSSTADPTLGNNDGNAPGAVVTTTLTPSADVITTKSGITNAAAGSIVSYTISTRNIGPSTADNVTISDSIIPGLTGVSVSDGGTYNAATGIVTFPAVSLINAASTSRSISFIAPADVNVSNTASSTSSTPDPIPANNNGNAPAALVTTTLTPSADVITTKSGITNAAAGSIVGYTITTRNIGPSTAENVTITDSIIPGLTGVVLSDSGTYNAITGIVTFQAVSLTNTASTTRSISFIAPNSGSISNTARSTSSTADPTPGNNDGTGVGALVTTTLTPSADVITTKSGITNAAPGSIVGYTITTRNIGPSTAENVTITDSIIPGLTGVVLSDSGTYNAATGIVTFPAVSLTNTASTTRSISFIAPNSGSISNTARSTSSTADPTPGNNDGTGVGALVTTTLTRIPIPIPTPTPKPNQPPITANTQVSLPPNSSRQVTGLGATDPDGSIASFTINTLPPTTQGVLFLGDPANGGIAITPGQVLTPAQIGQLFFRATVEFTGANFTYSATDNQGATSPATATFGATTSPIPTPTPTPNQPPVATNANLTIPPNSTTAVTGLGGSDPDGSIASFTITTLPPTTQGVLFLGDPANGGIAVTPGQVLTPAQIGQLFFRTTGAFTGANFTYSATDNQGSTSPATATVAALPPAANQPPVATNANLSIPPNSTTAVTGLGGTDPDGSIASFTINTLPPTTQGVLFLGDPANGGIAVTPGQVLTPAQIGQLFFRTTGAFTGANFTYSATDNSGATSPATATVATIPVSTSNPTPTPTPTPTANPNNQPPVSTNVNFSIPPNTSKLVTGLGGSDPDGSIASFTINTLPPSAQGILFLGDPANGGIAVTPGQVLTPAQIGQLFFRTTGEFTGTNFTYSATDNSGTISPSTATVAAILPTPNQPPLAANTNFGTSPNNTTPVTGLSATDPDGSIASFTINTLPPANQGILFLGDPANGGVAVTVGQTLTPEQVQQLFFRATGQFTGGTFTYSATDNSGTISPGTATVAAILRPNLPIPTPTPGTKTDIDCGCEAVIEPPQITFLPATQPPRISFDQPGTQIAAEEQTLKGTNRNDFIQGSNQAEKIIGFQGNDSLLGEGGSDEIYGDEGSDLIFGGLGSDVVYGGENNDLIFGGKGNDWIAGELGSDTILGDRGADTILGDTGQNNSQNPDDARDLIFGGEGADVINGNEGDDTIHSGKGNDIALGGKGKDLIFGEQGSDTLIGGVGDDSLFGGNRDNRAKDLGGRDLLYGGDGNDLLNGQESDDTLISGKGNDAVYGGKGNDLIFGQLGSDTVYGGEGIDTILGDSGSSNSVGNTGEQDLIFGGTGGDIIGGGIGNDTVYAGKGNDYVWGGKDNDLIWGEFGNDTLTGDSGDDTLHGGVRGFVKDTSGKDLLIGNVGADLLFGEESDDTISGGKGNDSLYGGKDNDFIHGDGDDDLIFGGDGNDELCGDDGNDTIYGDRADNQEVAVGTNGQQDCINGGAGNDLIYGNEGEDILNGDAGNDSLYGGEDNDILFGGEGDDWLFGGSGDNTLSGGAGSDQFILGAENGSNTILNFEVGIDKLVLTGGLSFQQLQFTPTQNGLLLQVTGTTQVLAKFVGGIGAIGSSDFVQST